MTTKADSSRRRMRAALILMLASTLFAGACGKKRTIPPPPPPPPAAAAPAPAPSGQSRPVVASFTVEPSSVARGQSAVLRWSATGAANVAIDHGMGTVPASGTLSIQPANTTTYLLTASSPGGDTTATATVTVTAPPPPPAAPDDNSRKGTLQSRIQSDLKDALFDYDSNNIRDDARAALTADAAALKQIIADFPTASINVEGHCDERGSAEYNLALGDRRASAARDFLTQLGVPADHLKTISYGKEQPVCTEADDACYQRNRRAHFSTGQ